MAARSRAAQSLFQPLAELSVDGRQVELLGVEFASGDRHLGVALVEQDYWVTHTLRARRDGETLAVELDPRALPEGFDVTAETYARNVAEESDGTGRAASCWSL